jgi:hypothetical protein
MQTILGVLFLITYPYRPSPFTYYFGRSPTGRAIRFNYGGKYLGGAAGIIGNAASIAISYNDMTSGKPDAISPIRFGYRLTGLISSMGTGAYIGAQWGNWYGAAGGLLLGGAFSAGEPIYDGYKYWQGHMSRYVTDFNNGIKIGWLPLRR